MHDLCKCTQTKFLFMQDFPSDSRSRALSLPPWCLLVYSKCHISHVGHSLIDQVRSSDPSLMICNIDDDLPTVLQPGEQYHTGGVAPAPVLMGSSANYRKTENLHFSEDEVHGNDSVSVPQAISRDLPYLPDQ